MKISTLIKKIYIKIIFLSKKVVLFILKLINSFFSIFGLKIQYQREIDYCNNQSKAISLFYNTIIQNNNEFKNGISCIVFSMDRAMQLHALLGSLFDKLSTPIPTYVIYRTTSPEHEKAYKDIIALFADKPIHFIKQIEKATFTQQLISILEEIITDKLFFLVDDILITENIDVNDIKNIDCKKYILSLRMGENLNYSYNVKKTQPLPQFIANDSKDKICWDWDKSQYDWKYIISVDGHIFLTKEILSMAKSISFNSPNTFEGNLQIFSPIFNPRLGLAYKKSKLFNIPCNKVQNDISNFHGEIHQNDLLEKWNDGYQIDYKQFFGFKNVGVHQDVAFNFIKK